MNEGQWRGRPASVWMLVLLDLAGTVMSIFGAIAPARPAFAAKLNVIGAVVVFAFAVALWVRGPSVSWRLIHLNIVVYVTAATVLVVQATTGAGALSVAFCYLLITVYIAMFVSRPVMRIYVAAMVGLLAMALALRDPVVLTLSVWLTPTLACIAAGEVLSWLTLHLRSASVTDPLTGLLNRAGFSDAAEREIAAAERCSTPATLAVVDLDDFKLVNDRGGHAAGDRLLAELAREWTLHSRPRDVVCRLGGDEFVFLLPNTDEAAAHLLMQRLQATSSARWCFGVAERHDGESLEEWLHRADQRLYEAKVTTTETTERIPSGS